MTYKTKLKVSVGFAVFIIFAMVAPVAAWAGFISADIPEPAEVPLAAYEQLTLAELYDTVRANRQGFIETRLDVVRKANEAKQRIEEYIKRGKPGSKQADSLKKDLETIKEAQRVLATVLSEITNSTTGSELGLVDNGSLSGIVPQTLMTEAVQTGKATQESDVSREYLEKLAKLYEDKTKQLVWVADSLVGIMVSE